MPAFLSLDPDVAAALLNLAALIKPYHDSFFAYAFAADAQGFDKFTKYIRKHSHMKGTQWKAIMFWLNPFITLTDVPPAPDFPVNTAMAIPDILSSMLQDETAIRQAIEDVVAMARAANENRVLGFLAKFVYAQMKSEKKLVKLMIWYQKVNGDPDEFQGAL
jgi:ferritin